MKCGIVLGSACREGDGCQRWYIRSRWLFTDRKRKPVIYLVVSDIQEITLSPVMCILLPYRFDLL